MNQRQPSREDRRGLKPPEEARAHARAAAKLALAKKAEEILILDLTSVSPVCDFFVICHGDSEVQVKAIADAILEGLGREGVGAWHTEGYAGRSWILLDYVDFVVHVFHHDTRLFYQLEELWADAPRETVAE